MIDSAIGMKPGERYLIESPERTRNFPGFFLDGKYYLGPELLTAVGWLEGQKFLYDELDAVGEPVFPDRVAGVIEDLTLILSDGARLKLKAFLFHAQEEQTVPITTPRGDVQAPNRPRRLHDEVVVMTGASNGIGRAAAHAFAAEGGRREAQKNRPMLIVAVAALALGGIALALARRTAEKRRLR